MKRDTHSIQFRLVSCFVGFSVLLMVILWFFQIIFLQTFYRQMKINEVKKLADSIAQQYDSETIGDTVHELSYKRGISITVYNESGQTEVGTFMNERGGGRMPSDAIRRLMQETDGVNNEKITVFGEKNKGKIIVACKKVTDGSAQPHYIVIDTYIEPVDATVRILSHQLIIVTVLSLLIALAMSFFIARKMSKPIQNMAKSAQQLAKGDYSVRFESGEYSEINKLAEVLNHTAAELGKTDQMRRDIVANVSHDLRTPLTIIKSYAEMIRDISGQNPEKRNAHAEVIIGESDRLALLVTDLLDLSKIEAGTENYSMTVFDVSQTVNTIVKRFEDLAVNSGLEFVVNCESGLYICGDCARIEQVVYNLVSNGINYIGEDNCLYVAAAKNSGVVRVSIRDNGKGIASDEIEHIWERYYKNSSRHRRLGNGTGIGLSIVKGILEAHGAEYGVNSNVGQGSEFWFEFKLQDKNGEGQTVKI